MPVPTYQVIADNEIDPESPITSSLLFRLRDNWLAFFGLDPSTPSPTFTLPPSTLVFQDVYYAFYGVNSANLFQAIIGPFPIGDSNWAMALNDLLGSLTITHAPNGQAVFVLFGVEVQYVSGVPTNALIYWRMNSAPPSNMTPAYTNGQQGVWTIPIGAGFVEIYACRTPLHDHFQIRATLIGTVTFLEFMFYRVDSTGGGQIVASFTNKRKRFVAI